MTDILIDCTPLANMSALRGIGTYVRGLVGGLHELHQREQKNWDIRAIISRDKMKTYNVVPLPDALMPLATVPTKKEDHARANGARFFFARLARQERAKLLHLTEPYGMPLDQGTPNIVTAHDLIPLLMAKDYLPPIPGLKTVLTARDWLRYRRACRVIAVSHATKRDLVNVLGIAPDRIDVVHHGVDHARFHTSATVGERAEISKVLHTTAPYVLYLGAGDARKDLNTLVEAFSVAKNTADVHLVIAGKLGTREGVLRELASKLGVESRVHLPGYIPESLVPALYRAARVNVFPSRYEGFGFPVIEALACGTPTITSPGSSLDEVAGDAALVAPCGNVDALANYLDDVLSSDSLRAQLRERGLLRAAQFTWQACAVNTMRSYEAALRE